MRTDKQTSRQADKEKEERSSCWLLWLLVALSPGLLVSVSAPLEAADVVEPPVVGRPANFSGAIGSYRVTMRANPTELQAEDPLTLTVRVTGSGDLERLRRPDLRGDERFAQQFHIDLLGDRFLPNERAREFDYRLRPRSAAVREIPALIFGYYLPGLVPARMGYQTTVASAIPLRVQPRTEVRPQDVQGAPSPSLAPDPVLHVVEGPLVLRHEEAFAFPGPFALPLLVLVPPLVCLLWYLLWRQRNPDAARVVRRRRSRAAREALQAVHRGGASHPGGAAEWAVEIVTTYLRKRLDLPGAVPTPAEVRAYLKQAGAPDAVAEEVVAFFHACDAGRFAPVAVHEPDHWAATADHLILTLEAELWLSRTW